jgi:hypothetical protein
VDLLVYGLRSADYRPSEIWIEHFLRHEDLLFLPFWRRAKDDSRLRPVLETIVRREFGLPVEPGPEDARRVLADVMARAEARGGFAVPSPDSMALELMGGAGGEAVARQFRRETRSAGRSRGVRGQGDWQLYYSSGRGGGLYALVYALELMRPPDAFARLVYDYSANSRYFETVASYGTDAAKRLFHDRTWEVLREGMPEHRLYGLVRQVAAIRPPALEREARRFLQDNARGPFTRHYVRQFVLARIGHPGINQTGLADWVRHQAPLDESEKEDLLWEIPAAHLQMSLRLGSNLHAGETRVEDALWRLANHPRPGFAGFLIQAYERYVEGEPVRWSVSLCTALAHTDSPELRDFIVAKLRRGGESRRRMLRALGLAEGDLTGLAWIVEQVTDMADPEARRTAAGLLGRIHTEDSAALLRRWAQSGDANVAEAASQALAAHEQYREEAEARQRQYEALVSGRLAPDDLLPPPEPWVWDGEKYVREGPTADEG